MENIGKIILISTGTFVMTFVAISVIAFILYYDYKVRMEKIADELRTKQMEKEMYSALIRTQENEKLYLAQNLHDELKPMLAAVRNKIYVHSLKYKNNHGEEIFEFADTIDLVNRTNEIVETISHDLVPSFLIKSGVFQALEFYVTQTSNNFLNVTFSNLLPEKSKNYFSPNQRLHIFRTVLELLKNITKHDNPQKIKISVKEENDLIFFLFMHNGLGIDDTNIKELKKSSQGLGLKSIHGRIELLNGKINYFKESDFSSIKLIIPLST